MVPNSSTATPVTGVGQPAQPTESVSYQHTLKQPFERSGVGLHSGQTVTLRVLPAAANRGRTFVRTDLLGSAEIPARVEAVTQTTLSTELTQGEAQVRTVEHLLAALSGLGVDNARIELDGPELPLLDGSAQHWVEAITAAGLVTQDQPRTVPSLSTPVQVQQGDAFVMALPAPSLRLTYGIDFELAAIGNQWHSWDPEKETFADAIAPARTFGLAHQIDYLRAQGLIQGGSLENALVCDANGWVNPPLRFDNEPARHKLLDLIGDLSLVGSLPPMHVVAYKASHGLHVAFARALLAQLD
jgi:UDP-3-O-[3-hydroxymyristoyl] N-acetylglucosamine deacetylase